jgi:hypothetical protein
MNCFLKPYQDVLQASGGVPLGHTSILGHISSQVMCKQVSRFSIASLLDIYLSNIQRLELVVSNGIN